MGKIGTASAVAQFACGGNPGFQAQNDVPYAEVRVHLEHAHPPAVPEGTFHRPARGRYSQELGCVIEGKSLGAEREV